MFGKRYCSIDNLSSSERGYSFLIIQTYFSVNKSIDPKRLGTISNRPTAKSNSLLSRSFKASFPCSDLILKEELEIFFQENLSNLEESVVQHHPLSKFYTISLLFLGRNLSTIMLTLDYLVH